ncbi:MAG TPA: 6-phosphofructokinase [Clostridiales bacterium]|nr:6-phosphofructokinase [Clostridiales bacterium]
MTKRIGVLTGGGDCPGLNAVLRAVAKTAMFKYGWEVIGFKDGYRGLVLNDYMIFGPGDASGILDKGGTILGTSNRDNPFKFRVEVNGKVEYKDMSEQVINNINSLGIDCMIMIGGDGTLTSARDFSRKGLKVIGVPKTIDNDLSGTDYTFGFMTAVETATEAIDKLHSTAESHHRVMILEVMGRYAGWIAIESGIAGGADVILIPEIPYNINKVADKVLERKKAGKHFSIIVVAEGAKSADGDIVVSKVLKDSPDPIRLGGIGNKIAEEIETLTGVETRVTILGHLQRGGRPIPYDRILSTRYGVAAVEMANAGKFGTMVSLKGSNITEVSLEEAVGATKTVPPDGELVRIAKSIGVSFGG